jgi:hypothetical protein
VISLPSVAGSLSMVTGMGSELWPAAKVGLQLARVGSTPVVALPPVMV